ncbi:MAG: hypothetical protein ABIR24_07165 [Verrucomicrobiota bacterium]
MSQETEIIEVPECSELPNPAPYDEDPVAFADFVLTSLLKHESASLYAKWPAKEKGVTWYVRPKNGNSDLELPSAISPSIGHFRSVLARFGYHYLSIQVYSGYACKFLRQREKVFRCEIFMSNNSQSGFWIEIHSAVYNPFQPDESDVQADAVGHGAFKALRAAIGKGVRD